ncbi:gas vesicle protein K [Actinomadura hibisca]|uniref:gas vesicle protein K n=1 Tax=Actinomadura hibisca TaxID=68565 RepID=UPI000A6F6063|nr:gas vesicle protein K [Actinomadura hibisca]
MTHPADRHPTPGTGREELRRRAAARDREPVSGEVTVSDADLGHGFTDDLLGGRRPAPGPATSSVAAGLADALGEAVSAAEPLQARAVRSTANASSGVMQRLRSDPETVERDLVKLVLTVVELIRQLMERQALRRVEDGSLTDEQVERLGLALMRLEEAMERLKDHFDLDDSDLNLDLGPLGPLLPE